MTPTEQLTGLLRAQPPVPPGKQRTAEEDEALRERMRLLERAPSVHALFELMIEKDTSFYLFDFQTYPTILLRAPRKAGVMTADEVCVARNGAGDLYLCDVAAGSVRFVVHDEDWASRPMSDSFDAFLTDVAWSCLELIEAEDVESMDQAYLARVRFAVDLVGSEPLNDDAREALAAIGAIEPPPG
jgi:hypothetical protein